MKIKCRFCNNDIVTLKCPNCGCLNQERIINDANFNATFTDYSYNRYSELLLKVYLLWIKLTAYLLGNNSSRSRLIRWLVKPLIGGKPLIDFSNNEKFIDVGCGRGYFHKCLPKSWLVYGTDIVQYGSRDSSIIVGNFEELHLDLKFSIVRSSHSLEHAQKPQSFLNKLIDITEINGILIISTPNAESFSSRLFKNNWFPVTVPSHYCIPNIKTLEKYLTSRGMMIMYKGTYTLFSSGGSLTELLKIKSHPTFFFVVFNLVLLPLTLIEILFDRADSLIIYAKKI